MEAINKIMIIDDDATFRSALSDLLKDDRYQFSTCSLEQMQVKLGGASGEQPHLVLVRTHEVEAMVHQIHPEIQVVHASPVILSNLEALKRMVDLGLENSALRAEIEKQHVFYQNLVGKSEGMQKIFELVKRVAQTHAHVLLTGPFGCGKEGIARAIHVSGPRAKKSFVTFNCAALPEKHSENELFKAGGSFELARGGTLYLENIGSLNVALQARLLKAIQEQKADAEHEVRIIGSNQVPLKKAIEEGRFREDLYYRLSVIPIEVPPLSEHIEDIPLLARHFLRKYAVINQTKAVQFSPIALRKLMERAWPGDVRELESVVERAVVLATGPVIAETDISDAPQGKGGEKVDLILSTLQGDYPTVDELEKRYMKIVLEKTKGRKEKAAKILGINRRTLYRKEREYGWIAESEEPASPLVEVKETAPKRPPETSH